MRRLQFLSSAQGMIFDCYQAECFIVDMRSFVGSSTLKNPTPGKLYTFIFRQSGMGGNSFTWPPQCQNGTQIDVNPQAVTVQNFVAWTGSLLQPTSPGAGQP